MKPGFGPPSLEFEAAHGFPLALVAGVDEVGRGCLAGPVVCAAVVLPTSSRRGGSAGGLPWGEITDSKALAPDARARLAAGLREELADFCVAEASVEEIDRLNIHHATLLAMERAVAGLRRARPAWILVDGNALPPGLRGRASTLVKGDLRSVAIAAASILAKVARDDFMVRLAEEHPRFGFEVHKGYPTPRHQAALAAHGPTSWHRRHFGPVARWHESRERDAGAPTPS